MGKIKIFMLISLISSFLVTLNHYTVMASPASPTLYVNLYRIQKVDSIEGFLEGEADWHYYIWVWDGEKWLSVNATAVPNKDDVVVDKTYDFAVRTTVTYVYIALLEDDFWSTWDLADISGYTGGGVDDWGTGAIPRGAQYQGTYYLKTNLLTGDQVISEGGYTKTSGDYDGSVGTDENDANLWFRVWDNYNSPVSNAGADQTVNTGEKVNFDGTNSHASEGSFLVKYEWDFESDGVIDAVGERTSYTYSRKGVYNVTLKVTDDIGEISSDKCIITVRNRPPTASFTYSPSAPTIQDTINFYDTSNDIDGSLASWYWEFGDGGTSTDRNPTHKYLNKGYFTVKLRVIDNDGDQGLITKTITIVNLAPTALFTYSPSSIIENQEVQFTDSSSDPEGKISSWSWDFGDGYKSTSLNPTHKYTKAGTYTVTLTVIDDEGALSTKSISITIQVPPFWTQTWFYLLILGIIAIIVVAVACQEEDQHRNKIQSISWIQVFTDSCLNHGLKKDLSFIIPIRTFNKLNLYARGIEYQAFIHGLISKTIVKVSYSLISARLLFPRYRGYITSIIRKGKHLYADIIFLHDFYSLTLGWEWDLLKGMEFQVIFIIVFLITFLMLWSLFVLEHLLDWINRRRFAKRLVSMGQLEQLVVKIGQVKLKEASEAIGMDVANVKALLSELIREGKVRGIFTSDGEGFVTEQKLEEEIRRDLE